MNPDRLPPLTNAQAAKVREHRRYWRDRGKVSVIRQGQVIGHICISVTEEDKVRRMWYDRDATLVRHVIERPLFTLTVEKTGPSSALLQQHER